MKAIRTISSSFLGTILLLGVSFGSFAQVEERASEQGLFMPNKGQWHQKVRFRSEVPGARFYIEDSGFSYFQFDGQRLEELHHHGDAKEGPKELAAHAVKVKLLGASASSFSRQGRSDHYANFYRGQDPSEWAERVYGYEKVRLEKAYPGIDVRFHRKAEGVKYSFICGPNSDPSRIRSRYEGQSSLSTNEEGDLRIGTSLGDIVEKAPKAYQWVDGEKHEVACRFEVRDRTVSFRFPEGYRDDRRLIIDPNVIFSTYTGSSADNWGNTATYDSDGALYAGGTVFDVGYPTTSGAFQVGFAGGEGGLGCDVSISKFTPDGTGLVYSTYLGGSKNELPHSLVVNDDDQLYVLGSTGSSDLPITNDAADTSFSGGSNASFGPIPFGKGSDAFVSKLSADGTSLLASTYLGGSGNDGLNEASDLNYNYGDILRGEIEVDSNGNAFVVSTTRSTDLPVTPGVFQDSLAGGQDAFLTKMDPDLSNIAFCSYYGGSDHDAGYAIERNPGLGYYISGGTKSGDLPMSKGWRTSSRGGVDGYVAHFSTGADSLMNASYIGTSDYDQSYFVGRDSSDNILLYGQSSGTYPVKNASYSNPNSGQFIQMLPPDLSNSVLSTVFGTGSGKVDISPSAFMVSECNNIYLSGWGGNVNQTHGVSSSTTKGLPITANAYQSSTDGSDFYLMVLSDSASALKYGSFFGGGVSEEHVDGGTSRFDDEGVVYQAVCAGCGSNSDFPTTPGAHSSQNLSYNCNLAAFKFDMSQVNAGIDPKDPPLSCKPDTFSFEVDSSAGGNLHIWDFGDGGRDTASSVSHYYSDTGTYQVTLVVMDTMTCEDPDTAQTKVHVFPPVPPEADSVSPICPGDSVRLNVDGGIGPKWDPIDSLSDPSVKDPVVYPDTSTNYQVTIQGCKTDSSVTTDTLNVLVPVHDIVSEASEDTSICPGDSTRVHASGGLSYEWNPDTSLSDPTVPSPKVFPKEPTLYRVSISDSNGCKNLDSVRVDIHEPPVLDPRDTSVCRYDSVRLDPGGPATADYTWTPSSGLNDDSVQDPLAAVGDSTSYQVRAIDNNGCSASDSLDLNIYPDPVLEPKDTTICRGDSIRLTVKGDSGTFRWSPAKQLDDPTLRDPLFTGWDSTIFRVKLTDSNGCSVLDSLKLNVKPLPTPSTHPDTSVCRGDSTELWVDGGSSYEWTPSSTLDSARSDSPLAFPDSSTLYSVKVLDDLGCEKEDSVKVSTLPLPKVTSTPDSFICIGDSITLHAEGGTDYDWSPGASLNDPNSSDPKAGPVRDTEYSVLVTDVNGCRARDSVRIEVDTSEPEPVLSPDTTICKWDQATLWAEGGQRYHWTPDEDLKDPGSSKTIASPNETTEYIVEVVNGCGTRYDSTLLAVQSPKATAGPDTVLCGGPDTVRLKASGGMSYRWDPSELVEEPDSATSLAYPPGSTDFQAIVSDSLGCKDTGKASVTVTSLPELSAGEDRKVQWGSRVDLKAEGDKGSFEWHPEDLFEDPDSRTVHFNPEENRTVRVELVDTNGCRSIDSIRIEVSGNLYAPNAFTPDGDGANDVFRFKGKKIEDFHLRIYDRWGELVFETRDMQNGWDGTVNGHPAKPDVYVYKVRYTESYKPEKVKTKTGHITLVR